MVILDFMHVNTLLYSQFQMYSLRWLLLGQIIQTLACH